MKNSNLDFDYEATKEYTTKQKDHQCDCAYCRNYYETFKKTYPKISGFLEKFGLEVNYPLETMPMGYDKKNNTFEYIAYYPIKGEMMQEELELELQGLKIFILKGSNLNNPCPNPEMDEPYILIEIVDIKLPWVLDEEVD